jgi:hypothetical protein
MSRFRPIAEVDPDMVEAMREWKRKAGRPETDDRGQDRSD